MRIVLTLVSLLFACPGCGPRAQSVTATPTDADGLRLLTARTLYAPADTIALTVVNDADRILGYGLCLGTLERRTVEGWEGPISKFYEIEPGQTIDCELDWRGLRPGGQATESYRLSQHLEPGTYRWCGRESEEQTPTSGSPDPRLFCSEPFEVGE